MAVTDRRISGRYVFRVAHGGATAGGEGGGEPPASEADAAVSAIGYRLSLFRIFLFYLCALLTGGVLMLVGYWQPTLVLRLTHVPCELRYATKVLVRRSSGQVGVEPLHTFRVENGLPELLPTRDAAGARRRMLRTSPSADQAAAKLLGAEHNTDSESESPRTISSANVNSGSGVKARLGSVSSAERKELREAAELRREAAAAEAAADEAITGGAPITIFEHRHMRYVWSPTADCFMRVYGDDTGYTLQQLYRRATRNRGTEALMQQERAVHFLLHSKNSVTVEVKSYMRLLFEEVLTPFYIFQLFAIVLWSAFEEYYYYAGAIALISIVSVALTLIETRRNAITLRDMVAHTGTVRWLRDGTPASAKVVDASQLLPGDVFLVEEDSIVPCDAVLLRGGAVLNESMLTGESVPVTKTPIATDGDDGSAYFHEDRHKGHTLFCGTHVVQTRTNVVVAVCLRTGFDTSKGELVRSILYPKPTRFRFYEDGLRFVGILAILAACGFIYTVVVLNRRGVKAGKIIVRGLDLVTTVVPPALPAAMTIGTMYALIRLKKKLIFCISPPRVNVSGKVKVVCFDKTGTLTEDGLTLSGVHTAHHGEFSSETSPNMDNIELKEGGVTVNMTHALATCHSLALLRRSAVAKQQLPESAHKQTLVGDPLEIQLFEATGWHLDEPRDQAAGSAGLGSADAQLLQNSSVVTSPHVSTMPYRLGSSDTAARREGWAASDGAAPRPLGLAIIKHYAFSSHKQRMAVLAAITPAPQEGSSGRPSPSPNSDKCVVYAYVKGAPERVRPLCSSESVPADFSSVLQQYTRDGLRVLAVAGRRLEVSSWAEACDLPRNEVESQLVLLGLVIFQNKVKAATRPALTELHEANIRTLMITGDNLLTACSVARECGMVPDEAVFVQAAAWSHNEDGPAPPTAALLAANAAADNDPFAEGGDRLQIDARDWITADDLRHGSARRRRDRGWHYDHLGGGIYGPPGRWRKLGALEANNGYHGSNGNGGSGYTSNGGRGSVSDTSETSADAGPFNGAPVQQVMTRPGDCRLVLAPVDDLDTVLKADNEPHGVSLLKYPRLKHDVPPPAWMPPTRGSVVVAVTGKEFARIREQLPEDYRRLIVAGTVFARMAPDQKAQLVEDLIDLGFTTAMCGDGANDCSALKAAHVGLSLSEAEASVAAPFTSATPNITCVPTLIREGRAALVTSFACFKFMALYSFIEFSSVLIAYYIDSNLGDFQFLYVDLILILVLAVLMSRTGAFHKLYPRRPPGRLVAFSILVSLLLQVTLHIATQTAALMLVKAQRWYVPLDPRPRASNIKCFETTTVFCVSVFQYIAVAVGFSAGPPYRAPLIRNVPFLLAAAVLTGINVMFLVYPPDFVEKLLQLQPLPDWRFRVLLLGVALGNAVLSISLETYLRSRSAQRLLSRLQGKQHYRNDYKNVARALLLDRWAYGAFCPGLDLATHSGGGAVATSKAAKPAKNANSKKAKAVARAAQAARVEQAEAAAAAGAPPPAQPPQSILAKMPEEQPDGYSEA